MGHVMAGATFRVTDPAAPRKAADEGIGQIAQELVSQIRADTPVRTGRLAASWEVEHEGASRYHARTSVPYARYVEYGTRDDPAQAPAGRALAEFRLRHG
jgi:hypothetical protein